MDELMEKIAACDIEVQDFFEALSEKEFMKLIKKWEEEITVWRERLFSKTHVGTPEFDELVTETDKILNFVSKQGYTNQQALNLLACTLGAALYNYYRDVFLI